MDLVERFRHELEAVGGEVHRGPASEMPGALAGCLRSMECEQILLAWPERKHAQGKPALADTLDQLTAARVLPGSAARTTCATIEQSAKTVGITSAVAALADTGTIVIESGAHGALEASLLPGAHVAILDARDVYPTFADWVEHGGRSLLAERSNVVLVTGPSRTADIEMTLTIGVHGPARLVVIVCEEEPTPSPSTLR